MDLDCFSRYVPCPNSTFESRNKKIQKEQTKRSFGSIAVFSMRLYKKKSWDMATPDFQRLVRMDPENAAWMISTWISMDFGAVLIVDIQNIQRLKESQGPIITYNNYKDLPQVKASPNQCDPNEIPSVYSVRPSATATWILPSCTWGRGDSCGTQRL